MFGTEVIVRLSLSTDGYNEPALSELNSVPAFNP